MADNIDGCIVTMQPFNNWRGALVVKATDGRTIVLNDDQYTSSNPVHEEYHTPPLTDIWWAMDENGEWFADSHYEVENCQLTTPYHKVPGKPDSITVRAEVVTTTGPTTTIPVSSTVPVIDTSPPLTFRVVTSDPITPDLTTTTTVGSTTSADVPVPTLPNTGFDVVLYGFIGFGLVLSGLAAQIRARYR